MMITLLYLCAHILSLVGRQDLGTNLKLGDLLATLTQPVLERLEGNTKEIELCVKETSLHTVCNILL